MLDKQAVENLSAELKIDSFTIYREYLQLLFLKYFYDQKESEQVFFKGGTAIRFLLGSFRFSEDLDFSSLLNEAKLIKLINKSLVDLNREVKVDFKQNKTIAQAFSGRLFEKLAGFDFALTVKLDFSLREKPVLPENSLIETVFPISPFPKVVHLAKEELLAEKIRAILTRNRGRDIFDLWFLLSKKVPIDWKLVNKKMKLYKKTADMAKLIQAVQKISQSQIKDDLNKFLPLNYRDLVLQLKDLTLKKLTDL